MPIVKFSDSSRVIDHSNGVSFRPIQRLGRIQKVAVQETQVTPSADGSYRCSFKAKASFKLNEKVGVNWELEGLQPALIKKFAWHSNNRGGASLFARVIPLNVP